MNSLPLEKIRSDIHENNLSIGYLLKAARVLWSRYWRRILVISIFDSLSLAAYLGFQKVLSISKQNSPLIGAGLITLLLAAIIFKIGGFLVDGMIKIQAGLEVEGSPVNSIQAVLKYLSRIPALIITGLAGLIAVVLPIIPIYLSSTFFLIIQPLVLPDWINLSLDVFFLAAVFPFLMLVPFPVLFQKKVGIPPYLTAFSYIRFRWWQSFAVSFLPLATTLFSLLCLTLIPPEYFVWIILAIALLAPAQVFSYLLVLLLFCNLDSRFQREGRQLIQIKRRQALILLGAVIGLWGLLVCCFFPLAIIVGG
jgi:hypothetical protein